MKEINLGVGLLWTDDLTYEDFTGLIRDIETWGYDHIWVMNEKFYRDMNTVAAVVAQNTRSVKIGSFVSDPYSVHPALTASFIGTLDVISNGRAILGMGAGGTGFPVMGLKRTRPAKAIQEAIAVIRQLWSGQEVDFHGEVIQCNRGRLNVRVRPDIPIVVATRGDHVLRMAGKVADGVMIATYAEPEGIGFALSEVAQSAEAAGRSMRDLTIFSRVDACICSDRRAAIEAVKPMVGIFLWTSYPDRSFVHRVGLRVPDPLEEIIARREYNLMAQYAHLVPDAFVEKFCWAGTAEEVAQKARRVVELGITNLTIVPHPPQGGSVHETIHAFATVVKPLVSQTVHPSR